MDDLTEERLDASTVDDLSTNICINEQTLNARPLSPVSSDVKDLEAVTPNHLLLGNKNSCLPYVPCAEEFVDHLLTKASLRKPYLGKIS